MRNFMVELGQSCDEAKIKRELILGFYGVEISRFPDITEVKKLVEYAEQLHFSWGVHYPLLCRELPGGDPLPLSLNYEERNQAFSAVEKDIAVIAKYGGKYLLLPFPRPVLVDPSFDAASWPFGDGAAWQKLEPYPSGDLEMNLYNMFGRFNLLSKQYQVQLLLKTDIMAAPFANGNLLETLCQEFPNLRLCLDIGLLHLQQVVDPTFDGLAFARRFAPYTDLLHLWNATIEDHWAGKRHPVTASQRPEKGYADIRLYLEAIFQSKKNVRILFAHDGSTMTKGEIKECYEWVSWLRSHI